MKLINKNISGCLLFFFTLLSVTLGDDPTDECVDLIWEMRNCSTQVHLPEKCDGTHQSNLVTCAEGILGKINQCPDKIAQKVIKHFVATYRISDRVICQDNMHKELIENKRCVDITKWLVPSIAYIIPGFLTEKGCKFFKTVFLVTALAQDKQNCFKIIENYIDLMYAKTTCSEHKVETPSKDDVKNIIDVFMNIHLCWVLHTRVPSCNATKSRRHQCVEDETLNKINNPNLKTLEKNVLSVTEMTDKVICEKNELKSDFESNRDCLRYAQALGGFLVGEVNGYYTEEGCAGLKYREKYKLAIVEEKCRPILETYWVEMKKILPCVETGGSVGGCGKINFSLMIFVVTLSVTFLTKIL